MTRSRSFVPENLARLDRTLADRYRAIGEQSREEGRQQGWNEGKRAGQLEQARVTLIRVIEARGLSVSLDLRARIEQCDELAVLDRWLIASLSTDSVGEVALDAPSGSSE